MMTSVRCTEPCHRIDVIKAALSEDYFCKIPCRTCLQTPKQALKEAISQLAPNWLPHFSECALFCPITLRRLHHLEESCCCPQPTTRADFFQEVFKTLLRDAPDVPVEDTGIFEAVQFDLNLALSGAATSWTQRLASRVIRWRTEMGIANTKHLMDKVEELVRALNAGSHVIVTLGSDGITRKISYFRPPTSNELSSVEATYGQAASLEREVTPSLNPDAEAFFPTEQTRTGSVGNAVTIDTQVKSPISVVLSKFPSTGGDDDSYEKVVADLETLCGDSQVVTAPTDGQSNSIDTPVEMDYVLDVNVSKDDLALMCEESDGEAGKPAESVTPLTNANTGDLSKVNWDDSQIHEVVSKTILNVIIKRESCSEEIKTSSKRKSRNPTQDSLGPYLALEKEFGNKRVYPLHGQKGGYPDLSLDRIANDS